MPTIADLKALAKEHNVHIPSRCNKGEIERLLTEAGIEFEASKPRKSPQPKQVARANTSPTVKSVSNSNDLVQLNLIQTNRECTIHLVPMSKIKDLTKLKTQIRLPPEERERNDELNVDYVELVCQETKHELQAGEVFEPSNGERVVLIANVLM